MSRAPPTSRDSVVPKPIEPHTFCHASGHPSPTDLKSSTALSQACITCGAAATLLANLMHHHPSDPRVALVDFTLAAVVTPILLMGVGIGNLMSPKRIWDECSLSIYQVTQSTPNPSMVAISPTGLDCLLDVRRLAQRHAACLAADWAAAAPAHAAGRAVRNKGAAARDVCSQWRSKVPKSHIAAALGAQRAGYGCWGLNFKKILQLPYKAFQCW